MSLHFLPPPPAHCPDGCGDFCPPRSTITHTLHLAFPRDPASAALIPKSGGRPAPTIADEGPARRLLRELLDHADVIAEAPGTTYLLVDVPRYALSELAMFDAEREDLENDDPAEDADATEDDDPAEDDEPDEDDGDGQDFDGRHETVSPALEPRLTARDEAIRRRLRKACPDAPSGRHAEAEAPTHPVLGVYRRIAR